LIRIIGNLLRGSEIRAKRYYVFPNHNEEGRGRFIEIEDEVVQLGRLHAHHRSHSRS